MFQKEDGDAREVDDDGGDVDGLPGVN